MLKLEALSLLISIKLLVQTLYDSYYIKWGLCFAVSIIQWLVDKHWVLI